MALREELEAMERDALAAFAAASDAAGLEAARIAFLGANGRDKELAKAFAAAAPEDKRALGPLLNRVKQAMRAGWEQAKERLATIEADAPIDLTLPQPQRRLGSIHPVNQVAAEIEAVFAGMGYELADGPHVELDEFNFTRLNIPPEHPARDHQDTFWLSTGKLLRTHTSSVQTRSYPRLTPPFRRVAIGTVFRYEAVDATHDNTFHQVEGFIVDKDITVAHMVGTIRTMLSAILLRDDVEVRLRPSYFPFVEPGFEVDVRLTSVDPTSRFSRWVELMGCGMIHPEVLRTGTIDPDAWQGFAFGLGLERLVMLRHGITDIRVFHGADLRSLHQFGAG